MTMKRNRQNIGAADQAELLQALELTEASGLSAAEVERRLDQYGANRLREAKSRSIVQIFVEQFKSGIVVMLLAAVALSLAFGDLLEAGAIAVVIIVNGLIGFFTELQAVRSMSALKELGSVEAAVYRDGQAQRIPAEELVPGDLVLFEGGDVVTADVRLTEASNLQADESALTGESVPVSKHTRPIEAEAPLAEQANMVFKGTAITRGSGKGLVVSTGMDTELGKISALVEEAEEEVTPLEKRLDALGHTLIWVTIAIAVLIGLTGVVAGKQLWLMIQTAIALAIAAIPEGLPIVATIALAQGMQRMAKRNALMNKLSSVETLGATTVICTDKTGTLTQNQMAASHIALHAGDIEVSQSETSFRQDDRPIEPDQLPPLYDALRVGVLCSNAELPEADQQTEANAIGDPMEVALLVAGTKAGMTRDALLERFPEVREVAFDPDLKMMATYHEENDHYLVAVKGAPDSVLPVCSHIRQKEHKHRKMHEKDRNQWLQRNDKMAQQGLRVLALAVKTVKDTDEKPYQDLEFLGFAGLLDPPRGDVQEAIQLCKDAGIRIVMVTGDQAVTARNVAQSVGLVEQTEQEVMGGHRLKSPDSLSADEKQHLLQMRIFSRVSPKQKLNLVTLHQQHGAIVAMTGDGVNDAPALEKADIGIAMGKHGTQVAREAADMILKDDAFSTIVEAVRYGRVIFDNIRKFVTFLLSGNMGEILVVGLATLFNAPLPILPLQILFLNFVADVFPALALGVGVGTTAVMERPPRDPQEPIMTRRHWYGIAGYGAIIAVSVLAAFWLAHTHLELEGTRAVTISFLTLAIARLWHVFNMRDVHSKVFINDVTTNPWVWGALLLCFGLILSAVYLPGLHQVLRLVSPTAEQWGFIVGMSLLPTLVVQAIKIMARTKKAHEK
jgi:P-type Ca2+ transporter type 2C